MTSSQLEREKETDRQRQTDAGIIIVRQNERQRLRHGKARQIKITDENRNICYGQIRHRERGREREV